MEKLLGFFFSKKKKINIFRLWKISLKHKWILLFAIITLIISTFLSLFLPTKINNFLKAFSFNAVSESFLNNILPYFFLFILNNLFSSIHHASIILFTNNFLKSIRKYYVENLLSKDIEFFDLKKTSDLFSLLTEDIQNLSDTSILGLFGFLKTISKGIGAIIMMFYFYFKLSSLLVIILPIVFIILRKRGKQAKKENENIREERHNSHHIVLESLENIRTVKSFSTEDKELNKYERQLQKIFDEENKHLLKSTIINNVIYIIFVLTIFLIIRYGIYLAQKDEGQNSKNLYPFIIYCLMFILSFNSIAEKIEKIQNSLVIAEKLFKIIDYIPNIKNAPINEYSFMKINGDIKFKNINFSYPTKKEVEILNNFNLEIKPGMRLGIVGASGSGKSTIISLLQRLYNCGHLDEKFSFNQDIDNKYISKKLDEYIELPNFNTNEESDLLQSKLVDSDSELITVNSEKDMNKYEENKKNSEILIDNINIKLLDIKNLHNQIGYVCQEPPLFNTTILENILYGIDKTAENYDKNELKKVLKMSRAEFVFDKNLFPKGLETIVGEKGSQLSGGQKQRIAIARALIKKPKILILDEATSALDVQSEFEIQNQIYNLSKDMNIIIVSHRLSSIKICDKIIVIDQGKIIESGTHQELIKLNGKYKELMNKQIINSIN